MVKFIIEVDEEFINSNADIASKSEELKENITGVDAKAAINKLLMCMPYSTINDEIKEGKTEFTVSKNYADNDEHKQQYENVVEYVALLVATNLVIERNKAEKENIDKTDK